MNRTSITASLLVAALAVSACSKGSKPSETPDSAQFQNISMTDRPSGIIPSTGTVTDGPTAISGPVSFADGEAAYQAGSYGEAIQIFEQYTVEKPENAWGHYMLGLSAWKGGEPAKAESAFDKALEIDPDHVKSLVNLSRVLIEQSRFDDAVARLTRAGELSPDSAEVSRLLGRTYHGQRMFNEAVAAYHRAIVLDDKDVWSMNNLGLLYLESGLPEKAMPPLARAIELKPDEAVFHNNLGMALEHTKRFAAAGEEYKAALSADAGYEKAQRNLSRVESVKVISEEAFDFGATAQRFVDELQIPPDTTTAAQ